MSGPDTFLDVVRARLPSIETAALTGPPERVEFLVPEHGRIPDFSRMPALRAIQTLSAGTDWLDGEVPPSVLLCSAGDSRTIPVAEWVVGALLGASTGLLSAARNREWRPSPPTELAGSCVVIVGHGQIGRAVASRLAPFGARVVGVTRNPAGETAGLGALDRLLAEADAVVDLLPLAEDTRGFFDARRLRLMKAGALFVNAGRGGTVNQAALLDALETGAIRAVLDVTEPEPLPPRHPLWGASGLLSLTSHQAGDSLRSDERALEVALSQLERFAAGLPMRYAVSRSDPI